MYSDDKNERREVMEALSTAAVMTVVVLLSLFAIAKFIYNLV